MTLLFGALLLASSSGSCLGQPSPAVPAPRPVWAAARGPDSVRSETLVFRPFGRVVVYRAREHPSRVVLFVSGDGGWNLGVVGMARQMASLDALVVGIDVRLYLAGLRKGAGACTDAAADFEALSQWVQRTLRFPSYSPPVLVGYSSGATLVYATLVQAPPGTFRGGLSLGFCPAFDLDRPFCRNGGLAAKPGPRGRGLRFLPADSVPVPWIVLQGEQDSTCAVVQAAAFVRRIRGAELVTLPAVGHGFGVESRWLPQFRQALERLTRDQLRALAAPAVRDLPLVELGSPRPSDVLAVIVSGDGGWASLDRQIGETFSAQGIPVVGFNSLQYFWKARTPNEIGRDLARIVGHYLEAWHARDVLLVGYSRGADVLPFMVSRLPPELRQRIRLVALLGPGRATDFEFHVTDWLGRPAESGLQLVGPEIEKLRGLRVLCLYGTEEKDSACPGLPAGLANLVPVEGGHHFGGAYRELAERILRSSRGD